jgi:hypothetical protein
MSLINRRRQFANQTVQRAGPILARFAKPLREGGFSMFAALDLASACAWLARRLLRTFPRSEAGDGTSEEIRFRVLLLPRAGLNEDIVSVLRGLPSVEVVTLPRRVLKAIASAFLPPEVDDNNYASASPAAKEAMQKYRAFLVRFWRAFDPKHRIQAVVSGNFGYFAERELAAALEGLGIPFVALHKENSWSLGGQAFWERIYCERRGPFLGRRILVYSPIERRLQLGAGIADAERIEVVGMPRLDAVHRWRKSHLGQVPDPVVLFASFPTDVSLPFAKNVDEDGRQQRITAVDAEAKHFDLAELCRGAHRAVYKLAVARPDINVVVKTKGRARDHENLAALFGIFDEGDVPPNMQIVHGGSPLSLIERAATVGGFHSTILLEALAAGRPVVVPWFAEVLDPVIRRYVFDLGDAVVRASSPAEFAACLEEFALERTPVPARLPPKTLKILREWLGNEDGEAGARAARAILRTIEKARPEVASAPASCG